MHRLAAGHFAVEDDLEYISDHMHQLYAANVVGEKRKAAGKADS
jgi:hypothetical protein